MLHHTTIFTTLALLVTLVTGCGGAHRYDGRLVAVDSLMKSDPDSALALVEALSPDSLANDGDRAYRDLLLTQARYKCYVKASSDTDINRALDYYRHHSTEREKLTRAFIYKGAVMEELNHPDSAMIYYKHAETTAPPDDYYNIGYSKLRIGELFMKQLSQDSMAINSLLEAESYFELVNDTALMISAYGKLGSICGVLYPDSAKYFLNQAIKLSQLYKPSSQYSHKSTLAGVYYYQQDYLTANKIAMDVLRNGADMSNETQFYYYAAMSYLKMGKIDSTRIILDIIPQPEDNVDSMNYFNILAELASTEKNHDKYKNYKESSTNITERILSDSQKESLNVARLEFEKLQREKEFSRKQTNLFLYFAAIILSLLLIASIVIYFLKNRLLINKKEKDEIEKELKITLDKLQDSAKRNQSVSELVGYRITALGELYNDIRVRIQNDNRVKKVVPLVSLLKDYYERREILEVTLNDNFWQLMKLSVDGEYNGIVSYVENNYPNLNEKDLKVFCLLCANLSPQIIRLCLNLTSARTITNYRSVIVRKKMGLNLSLDEFINQYMNGDLNKDNHA